MLRADDGKHVSVREDVRVLRVGDCTVRAQTFQITCILLLDYVSAFNWSAKVHAVDVQTHQNERHIFKTAFSTFCIPQYTAEASRICINRLFRISPFDPWRSNICTQVTIYQGYSSWARILPASTFSYDKRGRVLC